MNYIVLDLEWNQSPIGKEGEVESIPFEIIEIGAVKVNEKKEIIGEFSEIVQPQIYEEIDGNVQRIIHITMEQLKKGRTFPEVIKDFIQWCGDDYIFCTWGTMDLVELQRNMKYYKITPIAYKPFFYYDVQKLFSVFFEKEKRVRNLAFAAEFFHMKQDGEFHTAIADAKYTAKVFQKFDLKKIKKYMEIDYFHPPKKREDEIYITFKSYSKYISMGYSTRELLLQAKDVKGVVCCICQRRATKKIDWFSNSSKNYYGIFLCREHGFLKGKLRVKKADNEKYFAVKTIKIISKEEAIQLKKHKEDLYKKRQEKKLHNKANEN